MTTILEDYKRKSTLTLKDLNQEELERFKVLKAWRKKKYFQEGFFKAYMVFKDSELIEIAVLNIKKKEDLLYAKGVVKKKYLKYGDELYQLLKKKEEKEVEVLSLDAV